MSEDGGSPRPVDPNAMDVDSVNSPPAVSPQTGEWKYSWIAWILVEGVRELPFELKRWWIVFEFYGSWILRVLQSHFFSGYLYMAVSIFFLKGVVQSQFCG